MEETRYNSKRIRLKMGRNPILERAILLTQTQTQTLRLG